jgi:hypothetical protein
MKNRLGFVANSSSASFVLRFTAKHPKDWESSDFDLHSEADIESARKSATVIEKLDNDQYLIEVSCYTTMYNDFHDFPNWLTQLYMYHHTYGTYISHRVDEF